MSIEGTRIACWIPNATNTHTDCVICITFPPQQWLNKRASLLRYTDIASLVFLKVLSTRSIQTVAHKAGYPTTKGGLIVEGFIFPFIESSDQWFEFVAEAVFRRT